MSSRTERGAALIVALIFLLVLTLLGVGAMRTTNLQERMAGSLRDSNLAFQAAESALREGEQVLQLATLPVFDGSGGFLQMQPDAGQASFWNAYFLGGGSRMTAAAVAGTDSAPEYVIEELPPVPLQGGSLRFGALPEVGFYRVTARGVGGTADAVSLLQIAYRR